LPYTREVPVQVKVDDKLLDSIGRLLILVYNLLGPIGFWILFAAALLAGWSLRSKSKSTMVRGFEEALAEKERSIQRLTATERMYRIETLMRQHNMLPEEAQKLLLLSDNPTQQTTPAVKPKGRLWGLLGR
jgi:hypothetical protein